MSLTVASLHLYPVKSLGGYAVDTFLLTDRGAACDRRWMLVDDTDTFLSQRSLPAMACLHCSHTATGFRVTDIRDGSYLELPWILEHGNARQATVWDDGVQVLEAPKPWSRWFEDRLGQPLELVYMPDECERPTDPRYASAITSLSDGFPYLIVSQASLDALNARLSVDQRVPMDRFRPNIVIGGGGPHQEDHWRRIHIGHVEFELVKPCGRCIITTTDQRTGARAKEPLATLATYRRRANDPNKIDFGVNAIADPQGRIAVGDTVRVTQCAEANGH